MSAAVAPFIIILNPSNLANALDIACTTMAPLPGIILPMPYTLTVQEAPAIPISFVLGSTTIMDHVARQGRQKTVSKKIVRQRFFMVFIFMT
jgi:hypothetical protein